jgi:uncharacterized protein YhbP (UPF0306 family)
MDLKTLIREHLASQNIMQLATAGDDGPWACNIHYYSDDQLNIYWVSSETSAHSLHIAQNHKVSTAILVHEDSPEANYVIGFSIAGTAEIVSDDKIDKVAKGYGAKFSKRSDELAKSLKGAGPMHFYCLKPTKIVLIDSKNFPDKSRQELIP